MEDHGAARGHRVPARRTGRRRRRGHDARTRDAGDHRGRHRAAVAFGPGDPLYRLGLFPRRRAASDRRMSVKLLYFAWVRERVGKTEEVVDLPAGIRTVGGVVTWPARP